MTDHPTLADVLTVLGDWRHLPAYRLESRADPFVALFMRDVVSRHLGVPLAPTVIPELPLRKGTLWSEAAERNDSVKVDYALFSEDRADIYLVELKTDQSSRNEEQDAYLKRSAGAGFRAIVDGIIQIAAASSAKRKYLHLLHQLAALRYIEVPESVYDHAFPEVRRGLTNELGKVRNCVPDGTAVTIVYVQPRDDGENVIDFNRFAECIESRGEIGSLFAASLREWAEIDAGDRDPRKRTPG